MQVCLAMNSEKITFQIYQGRFCQPASPSVLTATLWPVYGLVGSPRFMFICSSPCHTGTCAGRQLFAVLQMKEKRKSKALVTVMIIVCSGTAVSKPLLSSWHFTQKADTTEVKQNRYRLFFHNLFLRETSTFHKRLVSCFQQTKTRDCPEQSTLLYSHTFPKISPCFSLPIQNNFCGLWMVTLAFPRKVKEQN